jgi:predicted transcriptional regulator
MEEAITKDILEKLYIEKKFSMHQIAPILKVSRPTVRKYLEKFGIRARTMDERHKLRGTDTIEYRQRISEGLKNSIKIQKEKEERRSKWIAKAILEELIITKTKVEISREYNISVKQLDSQLYGYGLKKLKYFNLETSILNLGKQYYLTFCSSCYSELWAKKRERNDKHKFCNKECDTKFKQIGLEFQDLANRETNLISCCRPCHSILEAESRLKEEKILYLIENGWKTV